MKLFWVSKRLAFGSTITTWQHVRQLHALGFTHIVNLRSSRQFKKKLRSFHGLWLPFPDDKQPRPRWFYREALRLYQHATQQPESKIFVMCHHGLCRSASLAYFYLRLSGASPKKSETFVLKARSRARVVPAYRGSGERFLEHHRTGSKKSHTKPYSGERR